MLMTQFCAQQMSLLRVSIILWLSNPSQYITGSMCESNGSKCWSMRMNVAWVNRIKLNQTYYLGLLNVFTYTLEIETDKISHLECWHVDNNYSDTGWVQSTCAELRDIREWNGITWVEYMNGTITYSFFMLWGYAKSV